MGSGCDVSEQVLFDILLYLPVISLLRFKTVCKSWYSIIESSIFITQHLYQNSEKSNLIIQTYKGKFFMLSGTKYELCSNMDFECIYPMHKLYTVSSCNGIVCLAYMLSGQYWRLSLWNPTTKQVRQAPESSFLDPSYGLLLFHTFAIGFEAKTNDYKIVSMSLGCCSNDLSNDSLVQIYSMRSDSWRTIHRGGDDFPITWIDTCINVVCNNGICLWIGGPDLDLAVIFYIDLMDEVYGTMSLPDDHNDVRAQSLAFLDDKVTYIKCKWRAPCSSYEIWTMNEFGVNGSWSIAYKLDDSILPSDGISLVNLLNNGEFIITIKYWDEHTRQNELCLLDLVTQEEKLLNVQDARSVISYSESLVSLKRTT